jgi:serine/threonine-protein kinase RsbW
MGAAVDGSEVFRFAVPARLEYRDAARGFLTYICRTLVDEELLPDGADHEVASAFVEAFNNAAVHAYRGLPPGDVEVEMRVSPERLEVRVSDFGREFEPAGVPEPDLEALPEGGLGLFIIRNFMDRVHYESRAGRNVLTMSKALTATSSGRANGEAATGDSRGRG